MTPLVFGMPVVVRVVGHVRQVLANGMVIVMTASGESLLVAPGDVTPVEVQS